MTATDLFDRPLSRRCALFGAGGVGAAAVLAACSSGSSDSSSGATAATGAATSPSSAAPSSGAATGSATSGSGGAAIAPLADVPVGGTGSGQSDGETVLLSQPTAGKVEGFSAVCPHQGGQVKPDGGKFRCSLHFSEFDLDGKVIKGPASKDLTSVAVAVSGADVVKA